MSKVTCSSPKLMANSGSFKLLRSSPGNITNPSIGLFGLQCLNTHILSLHIPKHACTHMHAYTHTHTHTHTYTHTHTHTHTHTPKDNSHDKTIPLNTNPNTTILVTPLWLCSVQRFSTLVKSTNRGITHTHTHTHTHINTHSNIHTLTHYCRPTIHVQLFEQICPWGTLACCWDVMQPTNKPTIPVNTHLNIVGSWWHCCGGSLYGISTHWGTTHTHTHTNIHTHTHTHTNTHTH